MRCSSFIISVLSLTMGVVVAQDIESKVLAVFEKHCAECHKKDEEPVLHGGASLAKLRNDPKIITPGKADTSELFRRISLAPGEKKHMPKSKGEPGGKDYRAPLQAEDIALLKQWIEGGGAPSPARTFISDEQATALIQQDLLRLPAEQQKLTRYLTLANLHNLPPAFVSAADLDSSRAAVAKLLNSLSYLPAITCPVAVDTQQTILRLDLNAYGWPKEFWERIASFYPYAILSGSVPEREVQRLTGCPMPRLRADWFVFALAQPPLYHEALQLPGRDLQTDGADAELEMRLGINVKRNLTGGRALRAGFEQSGVSQGNRLIEHHAQRDGGGYWKSYDFDKDRKDQPGGDLFTAPLGPPNAALTTDTSHIFKQDGGEIIFALPNGLQGYLLVNGTGRLINRGPTNIVHDTSRKDSAIINGVSCMSCHKTGMFPPPEDKMNADVLNANFLTGDERRLFSTLHDAAKVKAALDAGTARFTAALEKCGVNPAAKDEPVRALYDRFLAPITATQLASEFGQSDAHFLEDLKKSPEAKLRSIASRLESGNSPLPRQSFVSNFRDITKELGLGTLLEFLPPPFEEFGGAGKGPPPPPRAADGSFTNTLGMKFVPVPGTTVSFCIHETRSKDFAAFIADKNRGYAMTGSDADDWRTYEYEKVPVGRGASERAEDSIHPVANVSWLDAVAFCEWLSKKEGKTYRLPTDREWSVAVGIPQEPAGSPKDLDAKLGDVYPWGGKFVASAISGNYADTAMKAKFPDFSAIEGYRDGFATTAPVMSFAANQHGLYDMGGNLWEWVEGCYDGTDLQGKNKTLTSPRALRGGSWLYGGPAFLLSSDRYDYFPGRRNGGFGFRVVVVGSGG